MSQSSQPCYCNGPLGYDDCCGQYHRGTPAPTAEALMRSRFSAYMIQDYGYVVRTYASSQRANLTEEDIAKDAAHTRWLSLEVIKHNHQGKTAQVEFKAFYQIGQEFYVMHELSDFILEQGQWFYTQGEMGPATGQIKLKRNDPCLCLSGKKFKKCCGS